MSDMFDTNYDAYSQRGVTELVNRLDDALEALNVKGKGSRKFLLKALRSPCTEPDLGAYVKVYGLDRICLWQSLTAETFAELAPRCLLPEDLPFILRVPGHLPGCRRCLAEAYLYATYVETNIGIVEWMADAHLDLYGPFADGEAEEVAYGLRQVAYQYFISPERGARHDEEWREIRSVPCDDPRFERMVGDSIFNYAELLLAPDCDLRYLKRSDLYRLSPEARYRRLGRLSRHVGTCVRCAHVYAFEKREAAYQRDVSWRLKAAIWNGH